MRTSSALEQLYTFHELLSTDDLDRDEGVARFKPSMTPHSFGLLVLAAAPVTPAMIYIAAVLFGVPLLAVSWILRNKAKRAEEDLKRLYPEQPEPEEDGSGKRTWQFGIFDLLVLTTFAAVPCAIVRLPIDLMLKMLAIMPVWIGFSLWALGKPDARKFRSLAFKRRAALLHAVGSILAITPFCWNIYEQSSRLPAAAGAGFVLPMFIGPLLAIWRAGRAVWAEQIGRKRNSKSSVTFQ